MQSIVGIFTSQAAAFRAVQGLLAIGLPADAITFLCRECDDKLSSIPTTDAEAPGMGTTLGAYVGGVIGGSAGLALGSAVASMVVPGVGPVIAAGLGAAAALGLGGAAIGGAVGTSAEHEMDTGVPRDDVLFYRELLNQGRSLVVAEVDSDEMATAAHAILAKNDAEDVDAARHEWRAKRPPQAA